jgi:carbon-monoxide dehydrogenase medium subunit
MKPSPFVYHDPTTVADVTRLLSDFDDTRLLAGGQSLMPMMNFRVVQPGHLIDLNNVKEISFVRPDAERIAFGAMTRQRTLERSAEVRAACPIIPLALSYVGHRQTRARGTIGGSLSHFDPSAELCNLAALFDAELVLARKDGERVLSFEEFAVGYLTTALEPDEFLREIRFRKWPSNHRFGFEEFSMRHGDFAICAVSCLMSLGASGEVESMAIALSGVSPVPVRLRAAEAMAVGQKPGRELFRAVAVLAADIEAMTDAYVTADYRRHLARVLTYRALESAAARIKEKIAA